MLALQEHGRVCNMHLERLLALIKKACGTDRGPNVERYLGCGLLCQVLRKHKKTYGIDPRTVTRQTMIDCATPINPVSTGCFKTTKGGCNGTTKYMNQGVQQVAQKRQNEGKAKLTKEE